MKIIEHINTLKSVIGKARSEGRTIGLVPTMGALHEGHLSLIRCAADNDDFIVVSIFVNPTQFNDPADLEKYPRDLDTDIGLLKPMPVSVLFVPGVTEMYPEKDTRVFNLGPLDQIMEGEFRPGHFNGVAQIVSKLFDAVQADRAYFGQKDFQQLAVIRKLASIMNIETEIIGCPIVREPDGLAMSSRNQLLTSGQRAIAPLIYQVLTECRDMKEFLSPDQLRKFVRDKIEANDRLQLEYFEIVLEESLEPLKSWDQPGNKVGAIAVYLGSVRLIDNIYFD